MSNWLPTLTTIDDPIADDFWSYENDEGVQHVARVTLGRPAPVSGDPGEHWYCPLRIEHRAMASEIQCMVGVGPVDALTNAARVVSDHFRELRKVSPRARAPVKKPVTSAVIGESKLQDVFDRWGTDRSGMLVAGAPNWLLKRGNPVERRTYVIEHAMTFRPDVIWDDPDGMYVIELKSASKNEPLAIAQAFFEAFLLGQRANAPGRKPIPVIMTRFNHWNRGALSYLLEGGFQWGREFYLEFDVVEHDGRRWLWFDAPLAPLIPVKRPLPFLDEKTSFAHWYRIGSCEAWFGSEEPLASRDGVPQRPAIPDARYALCAATHGRPGEWLLWTGSPKETGEYSLLEAQTSPLGPT